LRAVKEKLTRKKNWTKTHEKETKEGGPKEKINLEKKENAKNCPPNQWVRGIIGGRKKNILPA